MKSAKTRFQYYWWIYILVVIIPVIVWSAVFNRLAEYESNEQVVICYIGSGLDNTALEKSLETNYAELTQQPLKDISVEVRIVSSQYTASVLETRVPYVDIVIISESCLYDGVGAAFFEPLKTDQLSNQLYYTENGIAYGLEIAGGEQKHRFDDFYNNSDQCYAFICNQSVNFGSLLENGPDEQDAAKRILDFLLE